MRIKSLNKDKSDWNQLRNHRMEHYGMSVSNEFYQHVPFFFNREGCQMNLIGHYRGASAFLICNGPSIVNGKFDLSLLKRPGVITYGMNNGPRTIRPNLWSCVDDPKRFMKSIWFDPCIMKIVPHSFAEKKLFDNETWQDMDRVVGECPNVIYFHRNEKFMAERFLYEDTVNWGNSGDNGGGRSVMLASMRILFLLGFRKVYLLGADFNMSETNTYHFDEQRHKGAVNGNLSTYEKLQNEYFPALKPYFESEGFYVYNCNPESKLKVFDFVDFNDAISEAITPLGDVENERTWGLYSKPEERQKWVNEPPEQNKAHLTKISERPTIPVYDYKNEEVRKIVLNTKQEVIGDAEGAFDNNQDDGGFVEENNENNENNETNVTFENENEREEIERVIPPRQTIRPPILSKPPIKPIVTPVRPHIVKIPSPMARHFVPQNIEQPVRNVAGQQPTQPPVVVHEQKIKPIYTGSKIVSKMPCGNMAMGSSGINPPQATKVMNNRMAKPIIKPGYITIPDNGK
jgi:hypothetical protein